jgi:hypothetical protein
METRDGSVVEYHLVRLGTSQGEAPRLEHQLAALTTLEQR